MAPPEYRPYADLRRRLAGSPVPLTAMQRFAWSYPTIRGQPSLRMCAAALRILGPLDTGLLERCFEVVVQRHESLRTRIVLADGLPRQQIDDVSGYQIDQTDLSLLTSVQAESEVARLAQNFVDEKVDMAIGPLLRVRLFKLSHSDHVLMVTLDHIVSDGVSNEILKREIFTLYRQAAQRKPFSLEELPIQFGDFAVWQHRARKMWLAQHGNYWRKRLIGAPFIGHAWEEDTGQPDLASAGMLHIPLGKKVSDGLRHLVPQGKAALPLAVLTVYVAALSRFLNQREFVLGFTLHGRDNQLELRNLIGFLAYSLYLRIEVRATDTFLDLFRRVSLEFATAFEHRDFGLMPDFIPGCVDTPLFNWTSTLQTSRLDAHIRNIGELRISPFRIKWSFLPVFYPFFSDTPAGIGATVYFRTNIYSTAAVNFFGQSLRAFASKFVEDPIALTSTVYT